MFPLLKSYRNKLLCSLKPLFYVRPKLIIIKILYQLINVIQLILYYLFVNGTKFIFSNLEMQIPVIQISVKSRPSAK